MKMIYLNALVSVPNAIGEEKIQKATNKDEPKINYHSLGLTPPKDEVERDEDGNIILEEEDMDLIPVPVTIPLNNLGSWVGMLDGGSRVYTKSNIAYDVIEECWEIDSVVEYTTMSWIEKKYLSFQSFFRQIKNKITGKKVVTYESIINAPENNPELINNK